MANCSECKFCELYSWDVNMGLCRRNPPTVAIVFDDDGETWRFEGIWPEVIASDDWCYQFEALAQRQQPRKQRDK